MLRNHSPIESVTCLQPLTITHFHLALAKLAIAALAHLLVRRRNQALARPHLLAIGVARRPLGPLAPAQECCKIIIEN